MKNNSCRASAALGVLWVGLVYLMASQLQSAQASDLRSLPALGREIYVHGSGFEGREVTARIGADGAKDSASIVPCVGCHGDDGRGRPEGGVLPPDVTWRYLTKAYGHQHGNLRQHPAFTEKSFSTALRQGLDPAGNRMDAAMPRYEFSGREISALVAYLKQLEFERAPGVSDKSIRVGTILPLTGPMAPVGEAMKAVLAGYFDAINGNGGIYNRKLELQVAALGATPRETLANARRTIVDTPIFAWVSPFISGMDKEMARLADDETIPVLAPVSLSTEQEGGGNRYSFYLFPGIKEQMQILVNYASTLTPDNRRAAIVHADNDAFGEVAKVLSGSGAPGGWARWDVVKFVPGRLDVKSIVDAIKGQGTDVIVFLGSGPELKQLLSAVDADGLRPYFLAAGSSFQNDIFDLPQGVVSKLLLAFPALPSEQSQEGVAALNALRAKAGIAGGHLASQINAYCGALLFTEVLKSMGRELNRKKFAAALEALYEFDTGLTHRLSFGPNRHIGSAGAYVVGIDVAGRVFKPLSGWMKVSTTNN